MSEGVFVLKGFDNNCGKNQDSNDDSNGTRLGKCLLPPYFDNFHQKILDASVREDDIWLVSFPRTGSTWCQEMIWLIRNNLDFETAQTTIQQLRAPLIESSIVLFEYIDSIPIKDDMTIPRFSRMNLPLDLLPSPLQKEKSKLASLFTDSVSFVEDLPSPRCVKSHLPLELLPEEILKKKPKMIYTMRNPKDLCISYYFHCQMIHKIYVEFDIFCDWFLNGLLPIGSIFDHYFSFWNKRDDLNILIINYEDMKIDTKETVKRIASFMERSLSDEDVDNICEFLSFQNMRDNKACNLQILVDNRQGNDFYNKSGIHFIRKGIVGDYINYMSPEMIEKFDKWIEKNTRGTDLKF
ncbi:unnamed protein product [Ceutorhynchus assimilis]|uniref:Sulfotransferase domain-containing protein n=1 Tax=Ceutorhynchus assimilis TaxID=467358 RepID=A0A9N9M9J1_9CUCU|nr:unnamed protein product [Ceutorhynchus assimilis]